MIKLVSVVGKTLPEVWEQSVVETLTHGIEIETEYDKPGDRPSLEVMLVASVTEPMSEPRIHRAMPGGIEDLEVYRQEVVDGIHDHWIDLGDPLKWQYSYHQRLRAYPPDGVDQIAQAINQLAKVPHSRRAQAITWVPEKDPFYEHPPCLERLQFRVIEQKLIMSAHMRSNDAYKAAFMNMYAFTDLQRYMAEILSERTGELVGVGQYNHIVDSYHIYGAYMDELDRFMDTLSKRSFEERTYKTEDVQWVIDDARREIGDGA